MWWWTKSNSTVPYILLWESVEAVHFHCLLSVWNCDSDICERDPCFQVHLNLQVWFKLFDACLFEAHWILQSQKNSGYSMNQPYWLIFSPLHKRITVNFSTLLRQIQLGISNHPGIERLSKRYRVDVSYPETRLTYSRLTRSIQPSISSLRNEVQAHLKDTMLSGLMVSDLTPHAYSIQRPNLTRRHSLLSYASTPRRASERFILLHSKHIFFLLEFFESVPASTHGESSFRHDTFRCRRGSSRSAKANISMYAWSVCDGQHLNAINVMLHVNLSFGGRCPPHAYRRCTALGDKFPPLTGFWLRSMFRPIHFPDPKIASVVQAP